MWRILIIALIVVVVLLVVLRRRGAGAAIGDDAMREGGVTPESTRISPDRHGTGGL
jgi:preprotein translocase subunit SecG